MKKILFAALGFALLLFLSGASQASPGRGGHGGTGGGGRGGGQGGGSHGGGGGGGSHGGGGYRGGGGSHGGGSGYHGGGGGYRGGGGYYGGRGGYYGGRGGYYGGRGGYYGGRGGYYGGRGGYHGGYWGRGGWVSPGYGWGWGGWGWGGWGWGWGWGGWGYPYGYGYGPYAGGGGYYMVEGGPAWAVIDTDVSPEEARVYLDTVYIGIADDFDGYPDYLYLRKGHYRLEFRLEGYETKVMEINARPGAMFDIGDKLAKIPGAKQYGSYETPPLPGGVQRFFGKQKGGANSEAVTAPDDVVPDSRYTEPADPNPSRGPETPQPQEGSSPSEGGGAPPPDTWRDPPGAPGSAPAAPSTRPRATRLTIYAEPPDAAVYLDDRFIGTAEEAAGQPRGFRVSPGAHTVTVSRPGYKDKTVEVTVVSGKTESVEIELER